MIAESRPKTIIAICRSRKERALDPRVCFFVGYLQIFYILRSLHKKWQFLYDSRVFMIRDRGIRVVKSSRENSKITYRINTQSLPLEEWRSLQSFSGQKQ